MKTTDKIIDFSEVEKFAKNKHKHPGETQRYGTAPYSVHLDAVVNNVIKYKKYLTYQEYPILIKAAYCHDLIEDTDVDINKLKEKTDPEVAELVYLVSNERGRTRKERNFKTYPKIWNNPLAKFLKLCDRIANTKNSRETGHRMYKVYCDEYPVFRYALKEKNSDQYAEMWNELDELCEFCPKEFCEEEVLKILNDNLSIIDTHVSENFTLTIDGKNKVVKEILDLLRERKIL